MHRPLVTITFVLFATLVQPRAADAGFWAWLEKWSGPGPFRARPYETLIVTFCGQDRPANRADAATVDRVMAWQKEWRFKPSPIAMADTFHQAQQAISRRLAAIRTQVPQPAAATQMPEAPVTDRDFLALLLENPSVTSLGYAAPVILPTAQTPAEPQVEPSPGEAARIFDAGLERHRIDRPDPGHRHQPCAHRIDGGAPLELAGGRGDLHFKACQSGDERRQRRIQLGPLLE